MAEQKFEKDLERLEQLVEALEEGGLSLDDALKRFEEGIKLARRCEKTLADAERKIEILSKNAQGDVVAEPFGDDEADASVDESADTESKSASPAKAKGPAPRKSAAHDAPAPDASDDEEEGGLLF